MKKHLHTFFLWVIVILLLPFYLLFLLGKTLFLKLRDGGDRDEFLPVGGCLTSASFTDQRRLGGFLNFFYDTRASFRKTNGSRYHEYTRKLLANLFEFYPSAHANDIRADNMDELTVHHIKPQSQIKNDPAAMTDLGNLAPCTRATHDKADAGARVESIQQTKQKYTFRFLAFSLLGLVASSFLLGFLTELFYRAFDAIQKKHLQKPKEFLAASARAGLSVLLLSLPMASVSYLLALASGRVSVLSLLLQSVFSVVLLFHGILSTVRAVGDRMTATALCLLPVHALFLFSVGIVIEVALSSVIAFPLLKDLAVSAILALIFALDRWIFGGIKGKAATAAQNEKTNEESGTESLTEAKTLSS